MPYGKWANFEQFLSFYRDIADLCQAHDLLVKQLAEAGRRVYQALVSSDEFRNSVAEAYQSDRLEFASGQTKESFTQRHELTQMTGWIAEHIMNGSARLGNHYVTAPIWNPFREEFLAFRQTEPIRELWEELDHKGQALLAIVDELICALKDARNSLSMKFDVPPEPFDERE